MDSWMNNEKCINTDFYFNLGFRILLLHSNINKSIVENIYQTEYAYFHYIEDWLPIEMLVFF